MKIGVFFKKEQGEVIKPMIIVRVIIAISMAIIFVFGIINDFDFALLKWVFVLAGIGSVFDGIAKYFQNYSSRGYVLEFVFALLWFALAFI
ncbi:hypothetical protein [Bacillus piscicola]|uniref:hypothetical protein n=1 Tax=Bacillus piscicola TaxID=1632684 RepID=UPI001F09ED82|nr:hypothetical protein [Bacillus piscicola]